LFTRKVSSSTQSTDGASVGEDEFDGPSEGTEEGALDNVGFEEGREDGTEDGMSEGALDTSSAKTSPFGGNATIVAIAAEGNEASRNFIVAF